MALIVGNWKMNLNPHEASTLAHRLEGKIKPSPRVEVVLCPPALDLYPLKKEAHKNFKLGAQNLHYVDEGAYTGEISGAMLKGLVDYVIVGHSERRRDAGEDDKVIAKKLGAAFRNGLTPILCVGESLLEREHKHGRKVVIDQLTADLAMLTADEVEKLVVAYEPVWAIGTGNFATPDDVEPMVGAIRETIEELYGENVGPEVRVLYGGSVDSHNAKAYLRLPGVDGLLVGGASLKYEEFAAIVAGAAEVSR